MSEQPDGPAWQEAFDHWFAGLLLALVMSAFVIAASSAPVAGRLFRSIEAEGQDAAMRARSLLAPRARIGREHTLPDGYVFIDLDSAACQAVEQDNPLCDSRSPATPKLAARAAMAVLVAHPSVVIIDVRMWGEDAAHADLVALAAKIGDRPTPVLSVAPFRPGEHAGEGLIEPRLIPPELSDGAVKFAPAYVWGERSSVRWYPRWVLARSNGQAARLTPTLPELAARYVDAKGDRNRLHDLDCAAFPLPSACIASQSQPPQQAAKIGEETALYSFPSLVPRHEHIRSKNAAMFQGLYDRYLASVAVTPAGQLNISPTLIQDKVVLIGTSAPEAQDLHPTPLGEMAGGEVILNMTRAFTAEATLKDPPIVPKLLREATFCLIGSVPYALFWFVVARLKRRLPKQNLLAWAGGSLISALFLLSIMASAVLMVALSFIRLGGEFNSGVTWDLYTPLAALSLEGLTDAAHALLGRFESAAKLIRKWVSAK